MDNVLAGLCSNGTDDVRDRSTYTRHLENVFNVKQEHACISQYGAAVENTEIACQAEPLNAWNCPERRT
ncbi:uncharacterized protein LOC143899235 isoform X3 [Temnothorax americanus]|uniref:uncharacterized protein LOC143899235 isoform X3 n=1 Tax=Temnothorax americanus TaxID=1964332 RepID=UPI0040683BCD